MKVYLDEKNMCHREYKAGYIEAEHAYFDTIPETAIECYRFIPDKDFIQCMDSKAENIIKKQWQASEDKYNKILYDIAVDIGAIVFEGGQE